MVLERYCVTTCEKKVLAGCVRRPQIRSRNDDTTF
jgi:hypothetical protein